MPFEAEFLQLYLLHLRPGCHHTPVGRHGMPKTLHSGLAYTTLPFKKSVQKVVNFFSAQYTWENRLTGKLIMTTLHLNQIIFLIVKVHITPLTKFRPQNPCGVKRSHTKNFRNLGVSLQLSFLVLKKSKIITSHQGIIIRLSMQETMIS